MALPGKPALALQLHSFIAIGLCLVLLVISANCDVQDGSGDESDEACTENSNSSACAKCRGLCNWMLTDSCDNATGSCICNPGVTECVCDPNYVAGSTCRTNPSICKRCSGFCTGNGVKNSSCDANTGGCFCKSSYGGPLCDICATPDMYFSETATSCVASTDLFPPGIPVVYSPVNSSYTISFLTPIPYGEDFVTYNNVTISIEGFMSLAGFAGGYNANRRVKKDIALIAPFWTSTTNKCPTDFANSQVHAAHFNLSNGANPNLSSRLLSAIQDSNLTDSEDFQPAEAVMGLWRNQRENFEDKEQNNFQAVITHDECQSFAVFVYPQGGMSWAGSPPAVIAAGEPVGPSGTDQVLSWTRNSSKPRVFALTPGCSPEVRARRRCLRRLNSLESNKSAPLPCPLTKIAADNTIVFRHAVEYNEAGLECYASEESSVYNAVRCCYDNTSSLVDVGPYQPFSTPNLTAEFSIYQDCRDGGVLEKFFAVRPPVTTLVQPYYQAHFHGRGHFTSLRSHYIYSEIVDRQTLISSRENGQTTFKLNAKILPGGVSNIEVSAGNVKIHITEGGFGINNYSQVIYRCPSRRNVGNIVYLCIDRIGLRFEHLSGQGIAVAIQVPDNILNNIDGALSNGRITFDYVIPTDKVEATTSTATTPTQQTQQPTTPPPDDFCQGNEACKNELMASSNVTAANITRYNDLTLSNIASAVTTRVPSLSPTAIDVASASPVQLTKISFISSHNDNISLALEGRQSYVYSIQNGSGFYLLLEKNLREAVRVRIGVNNRTFVVRTIRVNFCPCSVCSSVAETVVYQPPFAQKECNGSCKSGFTGKYCQTPLPDPCTAQPCGLRMCTGDVAHQNYSCAAECPFGTELALQRPRAVCQYADPCKSGNFTCPVGAKCEVDKDAFYAYNCRCPSSMLVDKTRATCEMPQTTTSAVEIIPKVPRAEVKGASSARVAKGNQTVFSCLIYNMEFGDVFWFNPDNETISSTPTQLHRIKTITNPNGTVETNLTITADNAYQNGKYFCKGKNDAGESLAGFEFTALMVPPKVVRHPKTMANNSKTVGSNIQFKCVLSGEGLGTLSWVDHDRYSVINNTRQMTYTLETFPDRVESTLTINLVSSSQAGKYTCRATNQYGTTEQAFQLALSHDGVDLINLALIGMASASGGTILIAIIAASIYKMCRQSQTKCTHILGHGQGVGYPMKKQAPVTAGPSRDVLHDFDNDRPPPVPERRLKPDGSGFYRN